MKFKSFFKTISGDIYVLNIDTSNFSDLKNESINAMKNKNINEFSYIKSEKDYGPFYLEISLTDCLKGAI